MDFLINLIIIIFGVLNLILFFKIWGMTNDISDIKKHLLNRQYSTLTQEEIFSTGQQNISDNDDCDQSRKVTRISDGKKMYVQYIIGDKYDCLDPQTKEPLGRYNISEIRAGW